MASRHILKTKIASISAQITNTLQNLSKILDVQTSKRSKKIPIPNTRDLSEPTPLALAIKEGNIEAVKLLVDAGDQVDKEITTERSWNLLHLIAEQNNPTLAKQLLDILGIDINTTKQADNLPCHRAIWSVMKQKTKHLWQKYVKADLEYDIKSSYDYTLLHKAVSSGSQEKVKTLLQLGANTEIKDLDGYIPLQVAVALEEKESMQCLIKER